VLKSNGIRPALHPARLRCSSFKNIPDILTRRALPAGRIAGLGATPDFQHGLPAAALIAYSSPTPSAPPPDVFWF
jgi:hypothetical protein